MKKANSRRDFGEYKMLVKSKRSQLKIQEMAFMLMAVIIFFVLAGMFFMIMMYRDLFAQANTLEKEKAISTAMNIANTPEFSCGESLCIDTDKLIVMQNRTNYKGFWPITSFVVHKISKDTEIIPCNLKNYPNCNFFEVYKEEVGTEQGVETFVSLCRKDKVGEFIYDKCELGRVIIGFEKKSPE